DQRDLPRELGGAGLQEAKGGRIGAAAGLDRQLEVVERVIAGGVRREAPRRPVFEPLVDGQNHHPAGASETARAQQAGEVRASSGVVALVPAQDLPHPLGHRAPSCRTYASASSTSATLPM